MQRTDVGGADGGLRSCLYKAALLRLGLLLTEPLLRSFFYPLLILDRLLLCFGPCVLSNLLSVVSCFRRVPFIFFEVLFFLPLWAFLLATHIIYARSQKITIPAHRICHTVYRIFHAAKRFTAQFAFFMYRPSPDKHIKHVVHVKSQPIKTAVTLAFWQAIKKKYKKCHFPLAYVKIVFYTARASAAKHLNRLLPDFES